jgi:hypothetical protein
MAEFFEIHVRAWAIHRRIGVGYGGKFIAIYAAE